MTFKYRDVALCAVVLALVCCPAFASGVIVYTDRAVFNAAVGSTTVEGFNLGYRLGLSGPISSTLTTDSMLGGTIYPGDLQPGATYSTSSYIDGSWPFNINDGSIYGNFLDSYINGEDRRPLTVAFTTPVAAVGFNTSVDEMPTFDIAIFFSDSTQIVRTETISDGGMKFFGYQSSAANITSVLIAGSGGYLGQGFGLDDFTFGGTGAGNAPEPATFLLFGAGLLGLPLLRRRKG